MLVVFEDVSAGKYQRTLTESSSSLKKATELRDLKFKDGMPEILGKKMTLITKVFYLLSTFYLLIYYFFCQSFHNF